MRLVTERLVLRPFTPEDVEDVHLYASDPAVCFFTDWGPNSREETEAYVAKAVDVGAPEDLAITLLNDMLGAGGVVPAGTVVGGLGAFPATHAPNVGVPDVRELGWVVRRDLWGQRLATEAVAALIAALIAEGSIRELQARCRPQNRASSRVMEHVGMTHVRTIERDCEVRGVWVDSELYRMPLPQ